MNAFSPVIFTLKEKSEFYFLFWRSSITSFMAIKSVKFVCGTSTDRQKKSNVFGVHFDIIYPIAQYLKAYIPVTIKVSKNFQKQR